MMRMSKSSQEKQQLAINLLPIFIHSTEGKEFEIIIKYNSWGVDIVDRDNNLLTELKCKPNYWFSNYFSGSAKINEKGIFLTSNHLKIGEVKISSSGLFGRIANIEIEEDIYILKRENLKLKFVAVSDDGETILTIDGKLYREKQRNLFGLIYFDDKLYYSVFMSKDLQKTTIPLLKVCGYCIRLFRAKDGGD
jgi:hypothetical protein